MPRHRRFRGAKLGSPATASWQNCSSTATLAVTICCEQAVGRGCAVPEIGFELQDDCGPGLRRGGTGLARQAGWPWCCPSDPEAAETFRERGWSVFEPDGQFPDEIPCRSRTQSPGESCRPLPSPVSSWTPSPASRGRNSGRCREFTEKFRTNPKASGINYEKIHAVKDDKVRTVRIDQKYRAVVLHPTEGDVYVLVWVDNHDEAMDWARKRTFEVNPVTGSLQVFSVSEAEQAVSPRRRRPRKPGLLDAL